MQRVDTERRKGKRSESTNRCEKISVAVMVNVLNLELNVSTL